MRTARLLRAGLLAAWAAAHASHLHAAEESLTAGRILSESVGARPSGLAEAGTALVGDLNALSFNPAGLSYMKRSEAIARFQASVGDVKGGSLAYGGHKGRLGWGLGMTFMDAGTIDLAFSDGRRFSRNAQRDVAGQLGLGLRLTDFLAVGAGGRFINSTLVEEYHASSFAGDAGLLVQMPVDGWLLGAAVRNMGGDLTYRNIGDPLPSETRVGTSYSYSPVADRRPEDIPTDDWYMRDQEETPIFTVFLDGIRDAEGATSGAAGFEWTKWPKAAFRVGYGMGENTTGLTLGFGLNLLKCSLDYSWRFVDDLSDAHRLSFSYYWGE